MKIYCHCKHCTNKVFLANEAKSRYQLFLSWGNPFAIKCSYCGGQNQIEVNNVRAEATRQSIPIATTLSGGLIGVLAGPLGVIIGLIAGGASGGAISYNEKQDVNNFNNNYI